MIKDQKLFLKIHQQVSQTVTVVPFAGSPSDRGEQCVHPKEPVIPPRGGDALVPSPGKPGAGLPAGLLLPSQGARLPLLGQEEAGPKERGLAR